MNALFATIEAQRRAGGTLVMVTCWLIVAAIAAAISQQVTMTRVPPARRWASIVAKRAFISGS